MNLDSQRCALVWMYGPLLELAAYLNMHIPAMHHDAAGARGGKKRKNVLISNMWQQQGESHCQASQL